MPATTVYNNWPDLLEATTTHIQGVMRDEQQMVRELHEGYRKQLRDIYVREERLLDLAADGELPRAKIHARLREVQVDRQRAQDGLKETGQQLQVGSETLVTYLKVLDDPGELYGRAPDSARRELNLAFFERLYIDEHRVVDAVLTEPILEINEAARSWAVTGNGGDLPVTRNEDPTARSDPQTMIEPTWPRSFRSGVRVSKSWSCEVPGHHNGRGDRI